MDAFEKAVNSVRIISAEAIEKAKSGHPGLPLGAAAFTLTLFQDFLKFNPDHPEFFDRDRFVLSSGHGSMLLYTLLHMYGYAITKEDLMNFRQVGSLTPGHPEYKHTPGVEVSTGPLGQGIANAVGMAIAEQRLAKEFNTEDITLIDHYTYALCGEGCLMEGIGYEASSLAGSLGLGKLIVLYDCNKITIEGSIKGIFDDDIASRQKALGWHVVTVRDGNDRLEIQKAIKKAKKITDKPSIIIINTVIGYGSALAGTNKIHGAPMGAENFEKMKSDLNWDQPPFTYSQELVPFFKKAVTRGKNAYKKWNSVLKQYAEKYPEKYAKFNRWLNGEYADLLDKLSDLNFTGPEATRKSGNTVINTVSECVDNLFGGSADLTPSNLTRLNNSGFFTKEDKSGNNIQFGIREHAMGAIVNGIIAHGGLKPYCSTFFVFSDYMKGALRMSAIMDMPALYVFTHDSIGVGEDGPTHQPIEQLIALRSIPNMVVFRPCDGKETAAAWYYAINSKHPTAICLTRQNLSQHCPDLKEALKGGYVISDSKNSQPQAIIIATGSEIDPSIAAQKLLAEQGIDVRVVSMPSIEVFESQPEQYKQSVLPNSVKARVCVEAGSAYSWYKYSGSYGEVVCMNQFGVSGKFVDLFKKYGFTDENIANAVRKSIQNANEQN